MNLFRPLALTLAISTALASNAYAHDLTLLYESARRFDNTYLAAQAQFEATLSKGEQAKSGVFPSVNLSLGTARNSRDASAPLGSADYSTNTNVLSLSQPLYRPGNWALYGQGEKQVKLAQVQLTLADQDLIIRVSQAYFDVLAAQDNLDLVATQKKAVAEQLAFAKRNFEVGTSTITDTREAQAQFDLINAQEISAEYDLRIKKEALSQLVGIKDARPQPMAQPSGLLGMPPDEMAAWIQKSEKSPAVLQAQIALEIAQLETEKAKAADRPTLDLTASYSSVKNIGASSGSNTGFNTNLKTIGVTLNYPIFAGFAIQGHIRETLALEEKARNELEGAKRAMAQSTRATYLGLVSGLSQLNALQAAELSSQSALDANKLGYQVGVRINMDVLNAQTQLYSTKVKLAKARYDVFMGSLKLRQASGTLEAKDLRSVSALLVQ